MDDDDDVDRDERATHRFRLFRSGFGLGIKLEENHQMAILIASSVLVLPNLNYF